MRKIRTHISHRTLFMPLSFVLMIFLFALLLNAASGCSYWQKRPRLRKQKISMTEPVHQIPPIMLDALNGHSMLVMQAPNSGWGIEIDRDERIADGLRLFITVRRPDPTFLYPQAIIEKNLLTDLPSTSTLEIYARILDTHEDISGKGYGLLHPVAGFED